MIAVGRFGPSSIALVAWRVAWVEEPASISWTVHSGEPLSASRKPESRLIACESYWEAWGSTT
jgi:hypothetical protein